MRLLKIFGLLALLGLTVSPLEADEIISTEHCKSDAINWADREHSYWQIPDFTVIDFYPLCDGRILSIGSSKRLALLNIANREITREWNLSFEPQVWTYEKETKTFYLVGFADNFGPLMLASLTEYDVGLRLVERKISATGSLSKVYGIHAAGNGILLATGVSNNNSILVPKDPYLGNRERDVMGIIDAKSGIWIYHYDVFGAEFAVYDSIGKSLISTTRKAQPSTIQTYRFDADNLRLSLGGSRNIGQTANGLTLSPDGSYLGVELMYLVYTPSGYAYPLLNPRNLEQDVAQLSGIGEAPPFIVFSPNRRQVLHPARDAENRFALQAYDLPTYNSAALISTPHPTFSCQEPFRQAWRTRPKISAGGRLAISTVACYDSYDKHPTNILVWDTIPVSDDQDDDGVLDVDDAYPTDASQYRDSDTDGIGDGVDSDDDNDGIPDHIDNCVYIANPGQEDNDRDTKGDVCDSDDDSDGIPDTFEILHGLNPFDSRDADVDSDGDSRSNLTEYHNNTNPKLADDNGQSLRSDSFYPLQVGTTWTYSTGRERVQSHSGSSARVEPDSGNWYVLDVNDTGVRLTKQYLRSIQGPDGKSHTVELSFDAPMMVLPKQVMVGEVFDQQGKVTAIISEYGSNQLTYRSQLVIEGIETRNTPVGQKRTVRTHRMYFVEGTVSGANVSLRFAQRFWFADGVGPIQIADTETTFSSILPAASVLQSFSLGSTSNGGVAEENSSSGGGGSIPVMFFLVIVGLIYVRGSSRPSV